MEKNKNIDDDMLKDVSKTDLNSPVSAPDQSYEELLEKLPLHDNLSLEELVRRHAILQTAKFKKSLWVAALKTDLISIKSKANQLFVKSTNNEEVNSFNEQFNKVIESLKHLIK
jgi:hypothetical protein